MRRLSHLRFMFRAVCGLAIAVVFLAAASPALAHPADEINERDVVRIGPNNIAIETTISVGALTLLRVWNDADRNGDHLLDDNEHEAYGRFLADGLTVRVDGAAAPVAYEPGSLTMPATLDGFERQAGEASGGIVSARFSLAYDGTGVSREITVAVHHYAKGFGGRPPDLYPIGTPEIGVVMQGGNDVNLRVTTAPGGPDMASPTIAPVRPATPGRVSLLQRLVHAPMRGPLYLLLGMAVAVAVGALHALTPGHGKTLVAAYLVGSQGRLRDAVTLGGVVTATHTGSVVALGVLTLLCTGLMTPTRLLPWIETISSLAIVLIGIALLQRRLRSARSTPGTAHRQRSSVSGHANLWHEHNDGTAHAHGWFGDTAHTHAPPTDLSLRALVLMGVSGGIVPCPDALAILLIAIAAGHILVGVCIILGFSVGLAAVLIALGVLLIQTNLPERLRQRRGLGDRFAAWAPTVSALVMVLIGIVSLGRALGALV